MQIRYQVFISSTFADLKEERAKISQALMEMDCIPAGMEIFPAIDEDQLEFIKKIIDDSDYYILVIGGRYGSVSDDGISFTEKEYDYAVSIGLKVIAFLHGDAESIPLSKSELDPALRLKLQDFRLKVAKGRLVKFWKTADELPGLVSLNLIKTIKAYPGIGWVRGNLIGDVTIYEDLNALRKENDLLKGKIETATKAETELKSELAGLDDEANFTLELHQYSEIEKWQVTITWGELFKLISPHLLRHPSDKIAKITLSNILYSFHHNPQRALIHIVDDNDFQTIKVHLTSLGLIKTNYSKTTRGHMDLFWVLTPLGNEIMLNLRSVKRKEIK